MKKLLIGLLISCATLSAQATQKVVNLMDVYRQALSSDPTFQAARAQWLSDKENLNITQAALLPSLDFQGTYEPSYNVYKTAGSPTFNYTNHETTLDTSITQQVFDYAQWAAVRSAAAGVKAATATFAAAAQDLIVRVATAYFNVLQASDDLYYTEAEKDAIGRQLKQTIARYQVGLDAITDVYEARAQYESILAQVIVAKNNLANQIQALEEITGKSYYNLTGIKNELPLITPKPTNINAWMAIAVKQNYSLLAAHYTTLSDKQLISEAAAGSYPTLSLNGGYNYNYDSNFQGVGHSDLQTVGVTGTVNFPVIQGGLVTASTHQATYNYQVAAANEASEYRSIIADTQQSYLGVLAGISQIKANQEAIIAQTSSVKATEAGYRVGTRTIIDVLTTQSDLFSAQTAYAQAEYQYLIDTLTLKQAAGTLSYKDLAQMNSWLSKRVSLAPYLNITKTNSFAPDRTILNKQLPAYQPDENIKPDTKQPPAKEKTEKPNQTTTQQQISLKLPAPQSPSNSSLNLPTPPVKS